MEYKFLGLLLPEYWRRNWPARVEVSRPDVDNTGYDLMLEAKRVLRYVQLKSSLSRTGVVPVNRMLEGKPGGCVVCFLISQNLEIQRFRWFGNGPGEKMPSVSNLRPISGNRVGLPISKMEELDLIGDVMDRLFDPKE